MKNNQPHKMPPAKLQLQLAWLLELVAGAEKYSKGSSH